jgi:hypothetical protein
MDVSAGRLKRFVLNLNQIKCKPRQEQPVYIAFCLFLVNQTKRFKQILGWARGRLRADSLRAPRRVIGHRPV